MSQLQNNFKKIIIKFLGGIVIFSFNPIIPLPFIESLTDYVIENGKYTATISKSNGMLTSLKLIESNYEIVADYPTYSLFYPEFVYEYPDGVNHKFYHPSMDIQNITTSYKKFEQLLIIEANWINGKINATWQYFFEPDKPYFRVIITRNVALENVYSNFQQCAMYNPDMDNSFIVNYQGQIELTSGNYDGERAYVTPFKQGANYLVTIAQHSLWTVFDFGNPTFFPTVAWSDNESNIHAGIIVTYTSPNQRGTISYHGGGSTRSHPGFAEAQFNWFGKSDSESLYLRKGTTFSMEMYFYQNYGSIDSLWNFSENLLNQNFEYTLPENYISASWGGRSSPSESYFWRYPQVSSDYINSQELFRHKGFAIPRSQNGSMDIHLFSLNLINIYDDQKTELTPIYGTIPLFDSLWVKESDTYYTGGMSWQVNDFNTKLFYTAYPHQRHITVSGKIYCNDSTNGSNFIELPLSSRTKKLFIDEENMLFTFISPDSLLDTVSIGLANISGSDSFFTTNNALYFRLQNETETDCQFQFDLYPTIQSSFRTDAQIETIEHQQVIPYKAYYLNATGISGLCYLPSTEYFLFNNRQVGDSLMFDLYANSAFNSLIFTTDIADESVANIQSLDKALSKVRLKSVGKNKHILNHPFNSKTLYHIILKKQNDIEIEEPDNYPIPEYFDIISINPNPFDGMTSIKLCTKGINFVSYEIYNIKGEKIFSSPNIFSFYNSQELMINLTPYPSGVYFCKFSTISSAKVVKLLFLK